MAYQLELDGVTYINNGRGWHDRTGANVPGVISERLDNILGGKLKAKEDRITDPNELLQLAAKYREQGALDRAMTICEKLIDISPNSEASAVTVMSSILRSKGEPNQAVALTEKFLGSNNPALLTTRAAALCDLGEWEYAKKTIARALAMIRGAVNKGEAFGVVRRIKAARPGLYDQ